MLANNNNNSGNNNNNNNNTNEGLGLGLGLTDNCPWPSEGCTEDFSRHGSVRWQKNRQSTSMRVQIFLRTALSLYIFNC